MLEEVRACFIEKSQEVCLGLKLDLELLCVLKQKHFFNVAKFVIKVCLF